MTSSKLIGCNIRGNIKVSPLALKIIDTPEFQRLRNIKQLGVCQYVFPAATHTRFEHSIGTYYLTSKMVEKLQKSYPDKIYNIPDIGQSQLTDFVCELIKIAGLCHDIGHGPFSHVFDELLSNNHHETRSCLIIEKICQRELQLSTHHIKFIQSIINPQPQHKGALYQIVSNYLNGIDVDKFDYLARDSYMLGLNRGFDPGRIIDEIIIDDNGNIAYPKHCASDIYDIFQNRYMLHKQIYNYKTVKIIEMMLCDIFRKIDPIFKFSDMITDMDQFCSLTDNSFFNILENIVKPMNYLRPMIEQKHMNLILEAYDIYQNIIQRKL